MTKSIEITKPRAVITQADKDMLEMIAAYLNDEFQGSKHFRPENAVELYKKLTDLLDSGYLEISD